MSLTVTHGSRPSASIELEDRHQSGEPHQAPHPLERREGAGLLAVGAGRAISGWGSGGAMVLGHAMGCMGR
jgi:hypothetical protein